MNGNGAERPVRTALVTGSSQGIGRAIAEWLAREGRVVGINGRDAAAVQATVEAFTAQGWRAFAAPGDVTRADDVARMVDAALGANGSLDILVNNAGGVAGVEASASFEAFEEAAWHAVLDRNLTGVFLCCRAAVPHMKARGWGRIVNVASESARVPIVPRTAGYAYAAAKSGILGLSRVLASELGPYGITVNVVAPGFTRSGPRIEAFYNALPPEKQAARVAATAVKRWAELPEIASAVGYLASEEASYCIGAVLDVNGGSFMP
ncbi:MAG TPA: SDR family NAD(P)-dependent oxidoreductase [Chloroflexota bacterium]|nr:SDR family NAD(P)-dependent oxidoreductase [Chloroflexota bacterium]